MDALIQSASTGLAGLEAAVYTLGGVAISVSVALIGVRLIRRAARQVG